MPDATPTPEAAPETPAAPDPVETERQARLLAEARAAYQEGRASVAEEHLRAAAGARVALPPQPDPLDTVSANDITLTPEQRKAAFDQAIRDRVEAAREETKREFEQRMAAERQAQTFETAIATVLGRRPELNDPKNTPSFQAAMTKAKAEADQRRETLTPLQLLQRAEQVYDTVFAPRPAPAVPFVEGGARPDLGGGVRPPEQVAQQSQLEELYGMKPGQIGQPPVGAEAWNQAAAEYIKERTKGLVDKGVNSSLDDVRRNFMS